MRTSSCGMQGVIDRCKIVITQCTCNWCHYMVPVGPETEYRCYKEQVPQWDQNNAHRNCPFSCVCGHNYDELMKRRAKMQPNS